MESTPSTPTRSDEILARFGKYEALEEIGIGGMATVYRARDTHLDRFVALKVLHPHLRGEGEARSRFAREAKSVARLEHPNIVRVLDFAGEESDVAFLAVELLTGPTLAEFRRSTRVLPPEVAAAIALAIARALEAAHAHGIIHRDVKPENVLLHRDETVKLTDFGIAHVTDAQAFTATGQILGSPGHMAPEQIEHGECDARSDLFSLGTVLYFLLTAHLPFEGKNPHQVLRRVVDGQYVDPRKWVSAIPAPLLRILTRLLEKAPEARYPSAAALIAALESFLRESGVDEPDALLARFFAAPAETTAALREDVIAHALREAERELSSRRRPSAYERLDYVLALQDGHPAALALLERASRRDRALRALRVSLPLVGLLGLVIAAALMAPEDEAAPYVRVDPPAPSAPAPEPEAEPVVVAMEAPRPPEPAPRAPTSEKEATPRDEPAPRAPAPRTPREVQLWPTPQNVKIGVDGEPPRPFGPGFRSITLEPGVHRFEVVDLSGCCEDRVEVVRVPAGTAPFVHRPSLSFR